MKVLVDTSVWSLALLRKSRIHDARVDQLSELILSGQTIYLLGVILQEILQGVRSREQFSKLKRHLESFPILPLKRDDYVQAAELSSTCRQQGIQASTIDYLIATAAIAYDCHLLTSDRDFVHIAGASPLLLL